MVDQLSGRIAKGLPLHALTAPPRFPTSDNGFDAFLGAAQDRYLGNGHARVVTNVNDLVCEDGLEGYGKQFPARFVGAARVGYPRDWSTKSGVAREPHLSTVDAIQIADECAVRIARHIPAITNLGMQHFLTVRAGARPWEDLALVPI